MLTTAIVRPPSANFAEGLTTFQSAPPDHARALAQHQSYCAALESCGLKLIHLEADEQYPDSSFVEDTAVLTERCAVLARPGAPSRSGEVEGMKEVLGRCYPELHSIRSPGTLDGGDVSQVEDHFLIGISQRTNEAGAQQLADFLAPYGYTASFVDIRGLDAILHLKSGLAYIGNDRLVVADSLRTRSEFQGFKLINVSAAAAYAANCVRANSCVLVAAGYPEFESSLQELGFETIALEMSEFQKMDGGLSCLSLRF